MNHEEKAPVQVTARPQVRTRAARPGEAPSHEELVPRRDRWHRLVSNRRKKTVTTAIITVIAIVFLIPFYWLFISALRPANRIFADAGNFLPTAVTLENFQRLFQETPIVMWFMNSVILAVGSVIGSLIVVTMAAYALAKIRFPFRNTIFVGILAS